MDASRRCAAAQDGTSGPTTALLALAAERFAAAAAPKPPLMVCDCCMPPAEQREMLRFPVDRIPVDLLREYLDAVSIGYSRFARDSGGGPGYEEAEREAVRERSRFLPRVLLGLARGERLHPIDECTLDKFAFDCPGVYAPGQLALLRRFAAAWFTGLCSGEDPTAPSPVTALLMLHRSGLGVLPQMLELLRRNAARPVAVRAFLELLALGSAPPSHRRDEPAFLPEHEPARSMFTRPVRRWLAEPATLSAFHEGLAQVLLNGAERPGETVEWEAWYEFLESDPRRIAAGARRGADDGLEEGVRPVHPLPEWHPALDGELEELLRRADGLFARHELRPPLRLCCEQCLSASDRERLLRTPVRRIPAGLLQDYLNALSGCDPAAGAELAHFLPRLLQAVVHGEELGFDAYRTLARLDLGAPGRYSPPELELVREFARAWLLRTCTVPGYGRLPCGSPGDFLEALDAAGLDGALGLTGIWAEHAFEPPALRGFLEYAGASVREAAWGPAPEPSDPPRPALDAWALRTRTLQRFRDGLEYVLLHRLERPGETYFWELDYDALEALLARRGAEPT
ncbi:MAG: hypothetical protein Q4E05_01515 [Pseudoclavibacter sp.]|nr:hypothetical protein [Pseudoclavibacter sp.]